MGLFGWCMRSREVSRIGWKAFYDVCIACWLGKSKRRNFHQRVSTICARYGIHGVENLFDAHAWVKS